MPELESSPSQLTSAVVKHSRLGIASFVLAIMGILSICVVFVANITLVNIGVRPTGLDRNTFLTLLRLLEIFSYCNIFINLIGLGLGIGTMFQKKTKKLFGTLGLVINALALCGVVGLALL
jgi:hypothetical protein